MELPVDTLANDNNSQRESEGKLRYMTDPLRHVLGGIGGRGYGGRGDNGNMAARTVIISRLHPKVHAPHTSHRTTLSIKKKGGGRVNLTI